VLGLDDEKRAGGDLAIAQTRGSELRDQGRELGLIRVLVVLLQTSPRCRTRLSLSTARRGAGASFAAAGRGIHGEYVVPTLPSRAARSGVRRRKFLNVIYFLRTLGEPENT
jgi:hypothetical protein